MLTTNPVPIRSRAFTRIRWAVVVALLTTTALTGLYVWQDWQEMVARTEERVMSFTSVTEAYVLRRLRETESGMKILGSLHRGKLANAAAIRETGDLHIASFPFIRALAVTEGSRVEMQSGAEAIALALLGWAREQAAAEGKLLVGSPLRVAKDPRPVIPMLVRYRGAEGRPDTVVVAAIRSDVLGIMHVALHLGPERASLLSSEKGIILSREPYDERAIGFNLTDYPSSGRVPSGRSPAVAMITSPIDGRTFVFGTRHLKDHPLMVRGAEEWNQAIAPWRERTGRSVAIAFIIGGAIVFLGWLAMQQTRAEQAALNARQQADELYGRALSTLKEGVVTSDANGSVLTFNPAAQNILGLTGDQLRGVTPFDPRWRARREDGSDFPGHDHPVMQVLRTGRPQFDVLMDLETGGGTRRWIQINALPIRTDGVLSGAVVSFSDVTEHRKTLSELKTLNNTLEARVADRTAQLKQLGSELAAAEERERRQIARDLHDDIAQTLAAARIHLSGLADDADGRGGEVAQAIGDLIKQADDSVRALAAQLAPPALVEIGLMAGLHLLAEEMSTKFRLEVQVTDDGEPKALTQAARTIVYRAVRELLINVSKHSGASQAMVDCRCEGSDLVIEVEDAGKGYLPQSGTGDERAGLGLKGVGERIGYIGGSLNYATPYGGGTRAILVIPLAQNASQKAELPA